MIKSNNKLVLNIDDLCEILDIGKNTAYNLLKSKEIESFKIGTCWKIPLKSVEEFIERKSSSNNSEGKILVESIDKDNDNGIL